jgi:hypothetical protein
MNDTNINRNAQPKMREALIDAIVFRIEQSVQDEIPSDFPEEIQ